MASDTIPAGHLRAFIERIERLEEEIKSLNADKSEIYKEARGSGFDVKAMRQCVAARKLDSAELQERNAIFDLYWEALTGSPRVHVHEGEQFDPETGEITNHELGVKQQDVKSLPAASGANEIAATFHPDPLTQQADGGQPDTSSAVAGAKSDGFDMAIVGQGGAEPGIPHGQAEHQTASAAQDGNPVVSASGASAPISEDYVPAFLRREAKPLRPNCQNPTNCAGYGSHTCHACTVAARESEDA